MITYNNKSNKKMIEFLGLPASGKTTLLHQKNIKNMIYVNEKFGSTFIERQFKKIFYMLKYFFNSPSTFVRDTKLIIGSNQKGWADLIRVLLNWYLIIYSYIDRVDEKEYVFAWDQGIFQALWTILQTSETPYDFEIMKILKGKKLPDQVIYLNEADETLRSRAENRTAITRLDYTNKKEIYHSREMMNIVLSILEETYVKELDS